MDTVRDYQEAAGVDGAAQPPLEGVEFLPAREHWDSTSYAVASYLACYRDLTLRPTGRTCWRSCGGARSVILIR